MISRSLSRHDLRQNVHLNSERVSLPTDVWHQLPGCNQPVLQALDVQQALFARHSWTAAFSNECAHECERNTHPTSNNRGDFILETDLERHSAGAHLLLISFFLFPLL